MARETDVNRSFVYDVLRGKSLVPNLEKLTRVAAILKVELEPGIFTEPRFWLRGWAFPLSESARSAGWGQR